MQEANIISFGKQTRLCPKQIGSAILNYINFSSTSTIFFCHSLPSNYFQSHHICSSTSTIYILALIYICLTIYPIFISYLLTIANVFVSKSLVMNQKKKRLLRKASLRNDILVSSLPLGEKKFEKRSKN